MAAEGYVLGRPVWLGARYLWTCMGACHGEGSAYAAGNRRPPSRACRADERGKLMKTAFYVLLLIFVLQLAAQNASTPAADPWKAISFLEGTWEGDTQGKEGVSVSGTYTFRRELGNHILARHATKDAG